MILIANAMKTLCLFSSVLCCAGYGARPERLLGKHCTNINLKYYYAVCYPTSVIRQVRATHFFPFLISSVFHLREGETRKKEIICEKKT
jgi:hypothetical protein